MVALNTANMLGITHKNINPIGLFTFVSEYQINSQVFQFNTSKAEEHFTQKKSREKEHSLYIYSKGGHLLK